LFSLELTKLY